ncbi:MAG: ATP-dependent zinc metalloprotease FtsH, partial [Candidatus Latescibacterota bacterium]|nr:ATP-dependent zinc metalloprotease FtsH [Candidatus Latescibacterota bacterium]
MAELDPKEQESPEQERAGISEDREEEKAEANREPERPRRQQTNRQHRRKSEDPDDSKKPWRRISKTLAFWIIFLLVAISASKFLGSNATNDEIILSYKEYKSLLNEGKIASATIIETEFHGHLVDPEFTLPSSGPQRSYDTFTVDLGVIDAETRTEWENQGVDFRFQQKPFNWLSVFFNFLPWLLFIGLWLFILRQMQGGPKGAFSFGKSRAKLVSEDRPKITFKDVAGSEEAKQELQEIIDFLRDPRKFQRLGGRIPKGVLLVGQPGTGKTWMAKAVAGEAEVPFFSMSGSDFVEMFVGVGASRVRDLFEQGKTNAPCIIFIDEMDAVGRHRGAGIGGGHDEREQTLNQLLVEMDGFESKEGVILIAATNRPDVLDPALMRPGRFDRQVVVDLPDVKGREAVLRVHTKNTPLAKDVSLKVLARGTPGLSPADLENLVNEAALFASRHDRSRVTMIDLENAKDKVMMGVERKSLVITDREKKLTSYHEIGHALIAKLIPESDPVHKVTIIPRGRGLGLTTYLPLDERHTYPKSYCVARLAYTLGGRVAEDIIFGEITTGATNDYSQATELARRMVCDWGMSDRLGPLSYGHKQEEIFLGRDMNNRRDYSDKTAEAIDDEIKRFIMEAATKAEELLKANIEVMHRMAEALLEFEVLDDPQLDKLMA